MKERLKIAGVFLIFGTLMAGCAGTVIKNDPVKEMQLAFENKETYSIVLEDMDLKDDFLHKYKIYEVLPDNSIKIETTEWEKVDDYFFSLHADDLGMEILSKNEQGRYNNLVTPPGFSHFIGNTTYGSWELEYPGDLFNTSRIWTFKPEYSYLNKELEIEGLSISQSEFNEFNSRYKYNRPYYGETTHKDTTKYGTRSAHWYYVRPIFFIRRNKTNNFYKSTPSLFPGGNRGGGGFGK